MNKLSQLRQHFSQTQSHTVHYPYYNMKTDTTTSLRLIEDLNEANPQRIIKQYFVHEKYEDDGSYHSIRCLGDNNEYCPMCEKSQQYYKDTDEVNGKRFYKRAIWVANCLIIDDALNLFKSQVVSLRLGRQLYDQIRSGLVEMFEDMDEDSPMPWDYHGGYNFRIKQSTLSGRNNYNLSSFARRPSSLTEQQIDIIESNLIDLQELIPPLSSLQTMMKVMFHW